MMDLINIILHLDKYIGVVLANYNEYFYALFLQFSEPQTGFVRHSFHRW